MIKIDRYDIGYSEYRSGNGEASIERDDGGEYVKYEDIKKLLNTSDNNKYETALKKIEEIIERDKKELFYDKCIDINHVLKCLNQDKP